MTRSAVGMGPALWNFALKYKCYTQNSKNLTFVKTFMTFLTFSCTHMIFYLLYYSLHYCSTIHKPIWTIMGQGKYHVRAPKYQKSHENVHKSQIFWILGTAFIFLWNFPERWPHPDSGTCHEVSHKSPPLKTLLQQVCVYTTLEIIGMHTFW